MDKWIKQYWPEESNCEGSLTVSAHTLTLEETSGAFIVLLCGIFLAGFVLLLENSRKTISLYFWRVVAMGRSVHRPSAKVHSKNQ